MKLLNLKYKQFSENFDSLMEIFKKLIYRLIGTIQLSLFDYILIIELTCSIEFLGKS